MLEQIPSFGHTDYLSIFNDLVVQEKYDQADIFIQSVLDNNLMRIMSRKDALAFLYRIGYVYPELVLSFLIYNKIDVPKPYLDCLKMSIGISKPSNRIYCGADQLVSIKSALYRHKVYMARILLYRFYKSFGLLPIALIKEGKVQIGINSKPKYRINNTLGVTTIVTTYNSSQFIRKSLYGLLNQTLLSHEIVVVDDGSLDDTVDIIEHEFPTVRLIRLIKNQGTYHARNIGVSVASNEFITFQDSDDWSHPQRLEIQLKNLQNNPALLANFSKFFRVNVLTGLPDARQLYPLMRLNLSSMMIRRNDFIKLGGFNANQRVESDKKFFEVLKSYPHSVAIIPKPLAVGAYRKDSLTMHSEFGFNRYGYSPHRALM